MSSSLRLSARRWRYDILRGLGLAAAVAIVWCFATGRTTVAAWRVPTSYSGDSLEILAHLKAASEWSVLPFFKDHVERLGAPFGADWSEYPAADDVLLLGLGQISRLIGLGAASNLALLFAQMSAAIAFYVASRWLRYRWEWAIAGAMLFAFSFHNMTRGLAHLSLVFTYTVPLTLLSCWLVARSERLRYLGPGGILCALTSVGVGIGNPYNLFLFLQLMGWATLAQALRARRMPNLHVGISALLIAMVTFVLVNADVWFSVDDEGAAPLMARSYGSVEQYALKPIELVLPPANHRVGALAFWGHRYLRWSDWRGETFSPYLGVAGAIGLVGLLATFGIQLLRGKRQPIGAAMQAVWILGFSVIGGLNSLLALFGGLHTFRATNRYSVFLLALGLIFLISRLSRWSRNWSPALSFGLAATLLTLGLLDQIPAPHWLDDLRRVETKLSDDQAFAAQMEKALPRGAMIFQLPFVEFPEARAVHRLTDYELFRPYLHTNTLRFTYGALKNRARSRWYREYASLPLSELIERLESNGFAAIYINRNGYEDSAQELVSSLVALGRTAILEGPSRQQVLIQLRPLPKPTLPLAASLTFGSGWNPREDRSGESMRWASGPATLSFFNPYPHPIKARLAMRASGVGSRHLKVEVNHHPLAELTIESGVQPWTIPTVDLRPGVNRFDFFTLEPPTRVSNERYRLRTFALQDLRFDVIER